MQAVLRSVLAFGLLLTFSDAASARRLALIIGQKDYINLTPLQKPLGDARAIAAALTRLKFDVVTIRENLDYPKFIAELAAFENLVGQGDEVVLFFSGHGVAIGGRNYLLPIDMIGGTAQESVVKRLAIDAGEMVREIRKREPRYVFAILDACRNNPFESIGKSIGLSRGLARMEPVAGEFILFAAGPGEEALDRLRNDDPAQTSVFTRVLLQHLERPGLSIQDIAFETKVGVRELARTIGREQFPEPFDRLTERPILSPAPRETPIIGRADEASAAYQSAMRYDASDTSLEEFLRRFPTDPRAGDVEARLSMRRDDAAFEAAKAADTIEAYERYRRAYPSGRHGRETEIAIRRLSSVAAASVEPQENARRFVRRAPEPYDRTIGTSLLPPSDVATNSLRVKDARRDNLVTVAFSPDGRILATGGFDRTVNIWEVGTGRLRRALNGHTGVVRAVAFSPDGVILASASDDRTIKLWDVGSGELKTTLSGHMSYVTSLAFSRSGGALASGSADKTVRVWNVRTGQVTQVFGGHMDRVYAVAFSPNGRMLASGSSDKTIKFWDVNTGSLTHQIPNGSASRIDALAFSPDGAMLASGGGDQTIKLWEPETGQLLKTLDKHVNGLAFSPDGRMLATGSHNNSVVIWNVETGRISQILKAYYSQAVGAVAFSPNGLTLASAAERDGLRLWNVASGAALARLHALPNGEWAAINEEGYIASSNAEQHLGLAWDGAIRGPVDEAFRRRWLKDSLPGLASPLAARPQ